jgi:tetratricopeptide (TPR) repeat protein
VHVLWADSDRAAPKHLLVQLMEGSSTVPVQTSYTNDTGWVDFGRLSVGDYHVVVTGDGIQRAESDQFEVDSRKITQTQEVSVRPIATGGAGASGGAMIGAADLNVPNAATKEFKKGNDAMGHEDWKKAEEHFNKAIEIYPQYAAALTNLGVVYGRLNDATDEREALQKAIYANDHYAPAYFNLAVLCIKQNSFVEAEGLLTKAVPLDPTNAKMLMFLANMQLMNQKFDAAIASAQRVHSMPHDNLALTHFIAARAFEHENRPKDALAELQLFLKEEPQGPRADHIREEVKMVKSRMQ